MAPLSQRAESTELGHLSEIYQERLGEAESVRLKCANSSVVWSATKVILRQIDTALENGFVKLAEMRLVSANGFATKLPEEYRGHFGELERRIGEAKAGS